MYLSFEKVTNTDQRKPGSIHQDECTAASHTQSPGIRHQCTHLQV